ncbi:hypothetical protein SAMN05444166_6611 [Singulisphaera sp. GP187]|nr:hypothetical protein SAMN05444166_6611 [Singulisphaera sp. GP187]
MRAVVRVGNQVTPFEQRLNLVGRQPLTGFHGGFACDHVQEIGQDRVGGRWQWFGREVLGEIAEEPLGRDPRKHGGSAMDEHGVSAERFDLEAQILEQVALFEDQRRLGAREVDRLGDEEPLRFDPPRSTRRFSSS